VIGRLLPAALRRRIPIVRERDALRRRVVELEGRLDHERLFPLEWANRRVRDRYGNDVVAGPFAGLRFPDWGMTDVDLFAPKLLGVFERELHGAVERLIAAAPALVVNVGAAEGYYAVGLARRLPETRVIAFEMDPKRAGALAEIADLNGVRDRVEVLAVRCEPGVLAAHLTDRASIVCDCDGCEGDLLDPSQVSALARCRMLVEVHDRIAPGTGDRLRSAFRQSHEISEIGSEPRHIADFPELDFMPWVTRHLAVTEFRGGPMKWLELTPRA
jgi:hypothetical protein